MSGFRHEALIYNDGHEFATGVVPFIQEGLAAGGAVMVAVDSEKIELLEHELGADAAKVRFEDMHSLGRNPGAIISAWQEFASAAKDGQSLWGVGEPAWPGRSETELEECRHHECLLNAAFADAPDFRLVCPYDASGLGDEVLERVGDGHPVVLTRDGPQPSNTYLDPDQLGELLTMPLAPAPDDALGIAFKLRDLRALRARMRTVARGAGLRDDELDDFILAINELAENSVRHGEGAGELRVWTEHGTVVAEIRDGGQIADPLVGRCRPASSEPRGGYGLWLTHQVCDLVQVRSSETGTAVRAHMRVPDAA